MSEDRGSCFFLILLDRDHVVFQPEYLGTGWFLPSPVGLGMCWQNWLQAAALVEPRLYLVGMARLCPRGGGTGLWLVLALGWFQPTSLAASLPAREALMVVSIYGINPLIDAAEISE